MFVVTYSSPSKGNFEIGRAESHDEALKIARKRGGRKDKRNPPDCLSVRGEPDAGIWIEIHGSIHDR